MGRTPLEVVLCICLDIFAGGKLHALRELVRPFGKSWVEVENLRASGETFVAPWFRTSEAEVRIVPRLRNLSGVDLMGEVAIYDPLRPGGAAECADVGRHTSDPGDEHVGVGEVQLLTQPQSHKGGARVGNPHARDHQAVIAAGIAVERGKATGDLEGLIKPILLEPKARFVLEHGDRQDFRV